MAELFKGFSRSEFACECGCGFDTVDVELAKVLADVREYFHSLCPSVKIRVDISGPNRCEKHNATVEGAVPGSSHTVGKAADFKVYLQDVQVDPRDVANYLEHKYPTKYGIGRYSNRTHVDVRATRHRWDFS